MSFKYAFEGLYSGILRERSMRIHICFCVFVVFFGFVCRITSAEWLVCIVLMGLVTAAELFNTAIELAVDRSGREPNPLAKASKDAAAAAVLVCALSAAVCGLIVFARRDRIMLAHSFFAGAPWTLVIFLLVLASAVWFVASAKKGIKK